ncbi:NUDIX domain-containing protein [Streptomyces sp. NPDC059247]|uniref:NUDIX domain-containing protein n=1 Tax=Streptomyces sp. NPDC059247 TaxID=3346790 RepID=UPI0036905F55
MGAGNLGPDGRRRRDGGHRPHATAARELREEVGLTGIELTHLFSNNADGYPVHVHHGHWDGDAATLTLGEGQALGWISPADFRTVPMHPSVLADTCGHPRTEQKYAVPGPPSVYGRRSPRRSALLPQLCGGLTGGGGRRRPRQ